MSKLSKSATTEIIMILLLLFFSGQDSEKGSLTIGHLQHLPVPYSGQFISNRFNLWNSLLAAEALKPANFTSELFPFWAVSPRVCFLSIARRLPSTEFTAQESSRAPSASFRRQFSSAAERSPIKQPRRCVSLALIFFLLVDFVSSLVARPLFRSGKKLDVHKFAAGLAGWLLLATGRGPALAGWPLGFFVLRKAK